MRGKRGLVFAVLLLLLTMLSFNLVSAECLGQYASGTRDVCATPWECDSITDYSFCRSALVEGEWNGWHCIGCDPQASPISFCEGFDTQECVKYGCSITQEPTYTSCSSFTQAQCANYPGECSWSDAPCPQGTAAEYSCTGTYTVESTVTGCDGRLTSTWDPIANSPTCGATNECYPDGISCSIVYQETGDCSAVPGCTYGPITTTSTKQCSNLPDNSDCTTLSSNQCILEQTCVSTCTPSTEICDRKDNDCDGSVDEGGVCTATCGVCTTDTECASGTCAMASDGNSYCVENCRPDSPTCEFLDSNRGCSGTSVAIVANTFSETVCRNYCENYGLAGNVFGCCYLDIFDGKCHAVSGVEISGTDESAGDCSFYPECSIFDVDAQCGIETCTDGNQNQGETDIDCGGPCAGCDNGEGCVVPADCLSDYCETGICQAAPTCSDGDQNQGETDIDCGGPCAGCDNGEGCVNPSDCSSGNCVAGICEPPAPSTELICNDNIDNDQDGSTDCDDPDCAGNQACIEPDTLCTSCVGDTDCSSSEVCVPGLNDANSYCVSSTNCGKDFVAPASCEVSLGTQSACMPDSNIYTCSSGNIWTVIDTCATDIDPEEVYWRGTAGNYITTYAYDKDIQNIVYIAIANPTMAPSTVTIMESDNVMGEDGQSETIATNVPLTMIDGHFAYQWTITEEILAARSGQEVDNKYEFYYIYNGNRADLIVTVNPITDPIADCYDGEKDVGEVGVDCEGICDSVNPDCCGNDICDTGIEDSTSCVGDCPVVLVKEARWDSALEITTSVQEILAGKNLIMQLINHDAGSFDFLLRETQENVDFGTFSGSETQGILQSTYPISLDDLESAKRNDDDNVFKLEFNAQGEISPELTLTVTTNDEGTGVPTCGNGKCEEGELDMDCYMEDCDTSLVFTCSDYWNGYLCGEDPEDLIADYGVECVFIQGDCVQGRTITVEGQAIGTCSYIEDPSNTDDCSDGFLSYSWTGDWNWAAGNDYPASYWGTEGYVCPEDEVSGEIVRCYYDPRGDSSECKNGQTTIPCPAQVQLPFFTWKNLVAAILILLIVYIIANSKKAAKKKVVRKKVSKKKTVTKKKKVATKKKK